MSLTDDFNPASGGADGPPRKKRERKKRPAPFSFRLSESERARLAVEAAGAPLGTYVRAKLLGDTAPLRLRRTGIAIEDRRILAQLVALIGRSRIAGNLNQLAHAANSGALPLDPDTIADLIDAVEAVREMRRLLLLALGLKPEGTP